MKNNITLKSENLVLRNLHKDDLQTLFEYRNDENCAKYQRWEDTSLDYLKNLIENNKEKNILDKETLQLAIGLASTNELVGDMFVAFKDKVITLGYTISPKHQRRGFAYEIIKSLVNYIFDNFDGYEIVCLVHPENEPSKNLLNKLNFKNEGYVEKIDSIIYYIKD